MANEQNLQPHKFKKGKSGNPNGRPKKPPEIDELLAEVLTDQVNGMDAAKAILINLREQALKGNLKAAEMLLDRAYGKPRQRQEVTGENDGPLSVIRVVSVGCYKCDVESKEK
jgi:hypothetical protein